MDDYDEFVEIDFIDEVAQIERLSEKRNEIKQVDWLQDFERRIRERHGDVASNLLNSERRLKDGR